MTISQEQKILKERLEELEKGSNEKLFPAGAKGKSSKKVVVKRKKKKERKEKRKKLRKRKKPREEKQEEAGEKKKKEKKEEEVKEEEKKEKEEKQEEPKKKVKKERRRKKEEEKKGKPKEEKKEPEKDARKIILDYLKKYKDKYKTEDLKKKIISAGYSEEEVEKVLSTLRAGGQKEEKEEPEKDEKKEEPKKKKKKVKKKRKKEVGEKEEKEPEEKREKATAIVKIKEQPRDNRPSLTEIKKCAENIKKIKKEMARVIIGQEETVDGLILGLLCNAHVLVEGVPGIAKTLAIRALAATSGCEVKRVQFTVDMLPTDITGLTTYTPEKGFEIIKGPIFANFIIGDEINRATPKTQSALIEGMQEKQVTIGRERYPLPSPFFVMATENPIESAGVYPLPEAQIDRFLFKLLMGYPKEENERKVMETNITIQRFEDFKLKAIVTPEEIVKMQNIVKKVYLDDSIRSYILSIVRKTRSKDFKNSEYISYGSSPRASIGLFIASKARALMQGRNFVLPEDVKSVVFKVLRHRLILTYKATIQKISPDDIVKEILNSVRV